MASESILGIVIDTVKHSDKYNIVTLYTRQRGRIPFLSSAAGGKSGRIRRARLQPLAIISTDVKFVANKEIQYLGSIEPATIWHDLYYNPMKSAIVMFLSEFLNKFLRQSQPDPGMWDYIARWLKILDSTRHSVANMHLAFLIGLLPHAGISPRIDESDSSLTDNWFDMREGILTHNYPSHRDVIPPDYIKALSLIIRMSASNSHAFRFTAEQRRRVLLETLHYYSVHYPGIDQLKSLDIITETFSAIR